jgi:hypothetical protein
VLVRLQRLSGRVRGVAGRAGDPVTAPRTPEEVPAGHQRGLGCWTCLCGEVLAYVGASAGVRERDALTPLLHQEAR